MDQREIIKYIDLIIKKIEDFDSFSVNNIVFDHLKPESQEEKDSFFELIDEIKRFGKNNDLFVARTKDGWCKLTDKGKKLKLSKKSFKSFNKSEEKRKWYNESWIGYLIAFIALSFSVYQYLNNRSLKDKFDALNSQTSLLDGKWKFETDSVPTIEIRNNQWIFLNRGYSSESKTHYQIQFMDSLPEFVQTDDHGQLVRLANNYDTLHLEILGHSKKFFSFMDYPSGKIIVLVPVD